MADDLTIVYIANTGIIELQGLKNNITAAYIDSANVEFTIKDHTGNPVSGGSWPAAMVYVAASNGIYRGTIPDSAVLLNRKIYTAVIDANGGANLIGHWEFPFLAEIRTGS